MKFTVASSDLQKALAKVSGVVPTKSTLPILENILFSLSKKTLTLLATDLEVSVSIGLQVNGSQDGVLAVPAKRLMDTIRALPDVQISVHADESSKKIRMVTESGEYNLIGEPGEEFPVGTVQHIIAFQHLAEGGRIAVAARDRILAVQPQGLEQFIHQRKGVATNDRQRIARCIRQPAPRQAQLVMTRVLRRTLQGEGTLNE